ncbi:redoxin domain-containing protein [bacterium]|nr:redoxin domain-containing protein [bacterium]
MAQLRQDYDKFMEIGAVIIVVGPEKPKPFKRYFEEHNLPFIGIADPEHNLMGLYEQQVKLLKMGRMPAQFIIDKVGVIRFSHYSKAMQDIPKTEEMLKLLGEL